MTKFVQVVPILEVSDVRASAAFYRDQLGFQPGDFFADPPMFCIVRRSDISIFLDQPRKPRPTPLNQYWAAYIYVDDVDGLAAEFTAKGIVLVRGPVDQPYGCREIDVRDPDGHIIGFGQNRASAAGQLTRS